MIAELEWTVIDELITKEFVDETSEGEYEETEDADNNGEVFDWFGMTSNELKVWRFVDDKSGVERWE